MSWPVATIGEVCEVVSGATPKTGRPEFWDGNVPWVTPKDLSELGQKHLSDTLRQITKAGLKSCSARMLPAQSVLFSSRAPIGLVAINTLPVCTNQGFKSLVPRFDLVSPDFLFWWLKTQEKHIQSKGRGATFKEVSKKIVEDLQIPLPPIYEQKRIAGILDAADALRAKRREALAELDTLLQSTFLDMFGDPVTNPMGWEKRELSHLCRFRSGYAWKAKSFNSDRIGSPVIRIQNVGTESSELIHTTEYPIERFWVERGEYLLSLSGSFRLAPWNGPRALLNQRIVKLTPESIVAPAYFGSALSTQLSAIETMGRHALVNNVALSDLKKVELCLPPLDLQHRFATIVESVEQQRAIQRAHLAELDTLFASLQSRAFRGDL